MALKDFTSTVAWRERPSTFAPLGNVQLPFRHFRKPRGIRRPDESWTGGDPQTAANAVNAVKVACVFRALHLPLRSGPFALIMLQIAVLLAMPGVFKYVSNAHDGALPAVTMYALWWVIGAIVALYGVLLGRVDFAEETPRINHFGRYRFIVGAFLQGALKG